MGINVLNFGAWGTHRGVGRVWIAITEWTDVDNQTFKLITGQTDAKLLISQLNDKMIMNHEINSGSQVNVSKYHQIARNYIFNQQKLNRR